MRKTTVIALLILCAGGILAMAQGPPQTWTWTVAVTADTNAANLVGDGQEYTTVYKDGGGYLVYVGVSKLTKTTYRFRLHIFNGSGRYISLPGVDPFRNVYLNPDFGPGYFPVAESCVLPTLPVCQNESGCSERLANFLALPHPVCGYASVLLEITVPLDIERLPVNGSQQVNGHVRLYIENTNRVLEAPGETFHNMDALTLPTGKAPLHVARTGLNMWELSVISSSAYMNYGEFYFGYLRKRPGDNKISMLADGPFMFNTTWTRE